MSPPTAPHKTSLSCDLSAGQRGNALPEPARGQTMENKLWWLLLFLILVLIALVAVFSGPGSLR
jgi:hypothetical protein